MWDDLKFYFAALARDWATGSEGQTLLEYAVILVSVAVLAAALLSIIGGDVVNFLTGIATGF
jgi:Flp pilus assembly pilin Flp